MARISRRSFLHDSGLLALGLSGCSVLSRRSPREEVLSALVLRIGAPDTQEILAQSRALASILRLPPSAANLEAARHALRKAALLWQRAYAFRNGPIIESHAFIRSAFWPTRPDAVREVLEGDQAFDDAFIAELGVDVKGVFALEHLLFEGPNGTAGGFFVGPGAMRARAFAIALADDALAYARKAD